MKFSALLILSTLALSTAALEVGSGGHHAGLVDRSHGDIFGRAVTTQKPRPTTVYRTHTKTVTRTVTRTVNARCTKKPTTTTKKAGAKPTTTSTSSSKKFSTTTKAKTTAKATTTSRKIITTTRAATVTTKAKTTAKATTTSRKVTTTTRAAVVTTSRAVTTTKRPTTTTRVPATTTTSRAAATTTPASSNGGCIATGTASCADQEAALAAHNSVRAIYHAAPLVWNQTLADGEATNTARCIWEHNREFLSAYGAGENIAAGGGGKDALSYWKVDGFVKMWTDEVKNYNFATGESTNGDMIGHFTQVVWQDTRSVGCAIRHCDNLQKSGFGSGVFYACAYYPPGNFIGQNTKKVLPA